MYTYNRCGSSGQDEGFDPKVALPRIQRVFEELTDRSWQWDGPFGPVFRRGHDVQFARFYSLGKPRLHCLVEWYGTGKFTSLYFAGKRGLGFAATPDKLINPSFLAQQLKNFAFDTT